MRASTSILLVFVALLAACASKKDKVSMSPADAAADPGGDKAAEDEAGEAFDEEDYAESPGQQKDNRDANATPEAQFAEYEQLLIQRESQLRGAGIALAHLGDEVRATDDTAETPNAGSVATKKSTKTKKQPRTPESTPSTAGGSVNMCTQICTLKQSTCDLEQKICDLATRHSDSERYQNVCQRAQQDCQAATTACDRCGG